MDSDENVTSLVGVSGTLYPDRNLDFPIGATNENIEQYPSAHSGGVQYTFHLLSTERTH